MESKKLSFDLSGKAQIPKSEQPEIPPQPNLEIVDDKTKPRSGAVIGWVRQGMFGDMLKKPKKADFNN